MGSVSYVVQALQRVNFLAGVARSDTIPHVSDVTHILATIEQGDATGADKLLPLVYEELRKLAAHRMANEAANHTLQPTAIPRSYSAHSPASFLPRANGMNENENSH
jgi:hypothetical protein